VHRSTPETLPQQQKPPSQTTRHADEAGAGVEAKAAPNARAATNPSESLTNLDFLFISHPPRIRFAGQSGEPDPLSL
jgi:hypothetical protein